MKLCTAMMFDGNVERFASKIVDLEAAGVDLVLVPEIYGFDQVSVLGYIAAKTERIELMTGKRWQDVFAAVAKRLEKFDSEDKKKS